MNKSVVRVLVITMALMTALIVVLIVPTAAEDANSFVLTYNQLEKEDHPQGITMMKFAEKVEELSGGQITVRTYSSGVLFSQEGEVTALMDGDLDMSNIAFQDISPYLPAASMFAAPYIFRNFEHVEKVFAPDSDIAADFYQMVEDACGYTVLGWMNQGTRILHTKTEKPIMKPEDLKGILLRMPPAADWITAGESLGAKVSPVAYSETYMALQTGTVDAHDAPLAGTYGSKFYEVTKQISMTNHMYDIKLICVNTKKFNQMTEQQQQWMREAAIYAGAEGNKATHKQEAELLDFMIDYGLIITEPDIEAFRTHSINYYTEKGLTANWDMNLYNRIQAVK